MYDTYGFDGPNMGANGGGYYSYGSGFDGFSGFGDFNDLGDIFSSFFGGNRRGGSTNSRNTVSKGADLKISIDITFKESYTGTEKEISINRNEACTECNGSGCAKGTTKAKCTTCGGKGTIRQVSSTLFGQVATQRTCSVCGGEGSVISTPCPNCKGKGTVKKSKKLKIKIPEGIDDGQTIVLKNEGEPGKNGGPNGDLYIVVRVKKDSIYSRRAEHVLCEVPITFTMATLGGEIEIPMVDGSKEIYKIPEGTATNTKFSIKNKGFKSISGNWRGDFVFTVVVQVPKKLTGEQRNLLVELAKTMDEQPPLKKRGIFG